MHVWNRTALRVLSILVLLLGLVGGAYLSNDRHNQQVATAASANGDVDASYQQQLADQQAAAYAAAAPQRAQIAAAQAAANKAATSAASAAAAQAKKAQDTARAKKTDTSSRSTTRSTTPSFGPIPKSCAAYTGNKAIGCTLLLSAGFGLDQMPCLDKMWTRESNWRTTAENSSSGSYGIPQALPASKMASAGSDYRSNPATQIKWGLSYIKSRYNTPCQAWTFWQSHNFY
jgi:hypothetical protein